MVVQVNIGRTRHVLSWARCWGHPWAAVVVALIGAVVRGEDDRAVDDVPAAFQQLQQQREGNRVDLGANFDNNVFHQAGGSFSLNPGGGRPSQAGGDGDQVPESPTLKIAGKLADDRLARIEAVCDLNDAQRRKLRLAMESDVRRLAEEIEAARRLYQGVQVNMNDQEGQQKWQQFQQDALRCRRLVLSLFDAESLVAKVLPTTLDSEQYARFAGEIAARRSGRWRGLVTAEMIKFDNLLGLDQRQYDEIEKLLLEREPALRVDGPATSRDPHAQQLLVWAALSEIDARRLQGIVSGRQWQALAQFANQGKAMQSHIEAQGLLEKVPK